MSPRDGAGDDAHICMHTRTSRVALEESEGRLARVCARLPRDHFLPSYSTQRPRSCTQTHASRSKLSHALHVKMSVTWWSRSHIASRHRHRLRSLGSWHNVPALLERKPSAGAPSRTLASHSRCATRSWPASKPASQPASQSKPNAGRYEK